MTPDERAPVCDRRTGRPRRRVAAHHPLLRPGRLVALAVRARTGKPLRARTPRPAASHQVDAGGRLGAAADPGRTRDGQRSPATATAAAAAETLAGRGTRSRRAPARVTRDSAAIRRAPAGARGLVPSPHDPAN